MGTLVFHFFNNHKQNDYLEMMVHHMVTIYLYIFSYMTNTMIGPVVAFIHDTVDVLISFTRVFAESDYKRVTGYTFMLAQIAWAYARIYWLFQCIYVSTVKLEVYVISPYVQPIFGFLLSCLLILHIYWQILMLRILYFYLSRGQVEDLQNKIEENKSAERKQETILKKVD